MAARHVYAVDGGAIVLEDHPDGIRLTIAPNVAAPASVILTLEHAEALERMLAAQALYFRAARGGG